MRRQQVRRWQPRGPRRRREARERSGRAGRQRVFLQPRDCRRVLLLLIVLLRHWRPHLRSHQRLQRAWQLLLLRERPAAQGFQRRRLRRYQWHPVRPICVRLLTPALLARLFISHLRSTTLPSAFPGGAHMPGPEENTDAEDCDNSKGPQDLCKAETRASLVDSGSTGGTADKDRSGRRLGHGRRQQGCRQHRCWQRCGQNRCRQHECRQHRCRQRCRCRRDSRDVAS
mmetsp:Transcript_24574/g.63966  ORF Transcript_24574/g.63966 Transcript_24574/m.63966 type:complete len:228 (+) Transcript_24574:216-899(+)